MTKTTGVSLASLNARKASEEAYEFEYVAPDGSLSGIFLSVIGTHSDTITKAMVETADEQRRRENVRAMKNSKARPENADLGSLAEDIDIGAKQAAKRLVGWRTPKDVEGLSAAQLERFQGIEEPWSEENALTLCRTNPDVSAQVMAKSNDLGNWMGNLPKAS